MAWQNGYQKELKLADFNSIVRELTDDLEDAEAQLLLAQFLRHNLGFTFELMSGVKLLPIQEIALRGLILKDNGLFVAGRGVGKCLCINDLCSTRDGLKKIKDVEVGDEVLSIKKFNKVKAKVFNPISEGFKIISKKKYSFEAKKGHRLYVWTTDCNFQWKFIEELSVGDKIVYRLGENIWKNKEEADQQIDFYYYIGLIIGDGHINSHRIDITNNDFEIHSFLKKFYNTNNIDFRQSKEIDKAITISTADRIIRDKVNLMGLSNFSRSYNKIFPSCIYTASQKEVSAFIRGMFDTDGCAEIRKNKKGKGVSGHITYSSVSLQLIKELQIFLLNFGIVSSWRIHHEAGTFIQKEKTYNRRKSYELRISGYENINNFNKYIKFNIKRKQDKVEKYINENSNLKNNDNFEIPYLSQHIKKTYRWSRKKYGKLFNKITFKRAKELESKDLFNQEDKGKLKYIFDNKLFFEEVAEIIPADVETCDIQVEEEECYWANGTISHNSFIISVFCCLYPIFFPNSKLCLISVNFRGARRLFEFSEKLIRGKNADLLNSCFPRDPKRLNDIISWKMDNGSEIFALPLSNGEGLRGTRASTVLVDEGLLISEEIQTSIIQPFLTARQDYAEEAHIRELEDALIRRGEITEADRMIFPSNKYLVFSSASYQFQYLYKMFCKYKALIEEQSVDLKRPSYFVMRASYEALPEESFMDRQAIQAAKDSGTENSEYFKREYKGIFTAAGDGFFDVKKIYECTIPAGQDPTVQVKGLKGAQYILAIDPSYAKAANSDYFAMAIYQLIPEKREIMLVHSYGRAGAELNQHYAYLTYLLLNFNIVYTVIDASGTEFIDSYNSSVIANDRNIKLGMFDPDINFNKDNYMEMIQKAKQEYNITTRHFVYPQLFSADTNRRMNEYLQAGIAAKKIWFAAGICNNDTAYRMHKDMVMPVKLKDSIGEKDITPSEFLEEQDNWIRETINQLALIQVKATSSGTLQYDLPGKVKQNDGPDKARRDNYTCCLLAYYGSKHYYDLVFAPTEEINTTFLPFCV